MNKTNELKIESFSGLMALTMAFWMQQHLAKQLLKGTLDREPTKLEIGFCLAEYWRRAISDWVHEKTGVCQQIHDLVWGG